MNTITERLTPGLAADEARLPEEARFREEGRGVRFDECDLRGQMRSAALLRHAQDLADLVESFGGSELMDVIRVGGSNDRGASQGVIAGQGAAMTGAAGDLS